MATNFISRWSTRKLSDEKSSQPIDSSNLISDSENDATSRINAEIVENEADKQVSPNEETFATETSNDTVHSDGSKQAESIEQRGEEPSSIASMLTSDSDPLVKKMALRKLFMSGEFSGVDALNDYDHDYSAVKSLSSDVVQTLREWVNDHDLTDNNESEITEQPSSTTIEQQCDNEIDQIENDDEMIAESNLESDCDFKDSAPSYKEFTPPTNNHTKNRTF